MRRLFYRNDNKNYQIEGLRGVSCFSIVFFHLFVIFPSKFDYSQTLNSNPLFRNIGGLAVSIFFLISGYYSLGKEKSRIRYLKKKLIRLWPPYFVSISFIFALTHLFELPGRTVSFSDFLLNVCFINGFVGVSYVDTAHWYISTLLACLFVHSVVLPLDYKPRHAFYWFWLCVILILRYWDSDNRNVHFLISGLYKLFGEEYAPIFIIGSSFADIIRRERNYKTIPILSIAFSIIVKYLVANGFERFIVVVVAIPIFILSGMEKMKIFEYRIPIYLGSISYYIYLIHQNVGFVLILLFVSIVGHYSFWVSFFAFPLVLLLGFLLSIIDGEFQKTVKCISQKKR